MTKSRGAQASHKLSVPPGTDNFEIDILNTFGGYVSSIDSTNTNPNILIRGSLNVYKKISGTIANRPGQLLYDALVDSTSAKISSGFVWETSLGVIFPMRLANSKIQFESSVTGTRVWYDLLTGLGATQTQAVFDTWWDNTDKKDKVLFVCHDTNTYAWDGGMALFVSGNIVVGVITTMTIDSAGSGYSAGNVLTITGGGGTLGTATVNTVDSSGAITQITLLAAGSGYSTTVGAATSGGAGSGATISIVVTTGVITLDRNAGTAGYAFSGSVVINGNTYTYTGLSGSTLTGVGSDSSAEATNSVVMSKVITNTNTPDSSFTNDFIHVVGNQLYSGSYTSELIYLSKNTDYTSHAASSPRLTGEGDVIILDGAGKGIGARASQAYIFAGTNFVHPISFNQITIGSTLSEQTQRGKIDLGDQVSAKGHDFIDSLSDNIVYLDQANQVRTLGIFRNITTQKAAMLSQDVQDELAETDFTNGQLRVISDRRGDIYYITAPNSGYLYIFQERTNVDPTGVIVTERLWQPPQIANFTRIYSINGKTYGFSNANPQIYQIWDTGQWHDDSPSGQLPYACIMLLAYQNGGRRQGKIAFEKWYAEGYATAGTQLFGAIYYDYQGATQTLSTIFNDPSQNSPFSKTYTGLVPPSLGGASLGDNPLGDGLNILPDDQATVPKFRNINDMQGTNVYEFAPMFYTQQADARWEILATGMNIHIAAIETAAELQK